MRESSHFSRDLTTLRGPGSASCTGEMMQHIDHLCKHNEPQFEGDPHKCQDVASAWMIVFARVTESQPHAGAFKGPFEQLFRRN